MENFVVCRGHVNRYIEALQKRLDGWGVLWDKPGAGLLAYMDDKSERQLARRSVAELATKGAASSDYPHAETLRLGRHPSHLLRRLP